MASSVFYKFRNQRELSQISFDGNSISVFELKREIILAAGLGNGTDFDLHLYPADDPSTELVDDTDLVVRTSSVIAKRTPAAKGTGKAQRYVTGRAPRAPLTALKKNEPPKATASNPNPGPGGQLSEQDAEAAFLAESNEVWDQHLSHLKESKPTYRPGFNKKPPTAPAHDPPPGYVCYRCQQKGHWIQACPTNSDPDFKPVARVKRTTGIPRSFLKAHNAEDGDPESGSVFMDSSGVLVTVRTDDRAWSKFQEKTNVIKQQAAKIEAANKELRERGLECPIDESLFVDPVKTPCCGKTYCHRCIDDALVEGGLVCPNCSEESVLIDDLVPDEEMVEKIRAYEAEKASEKLEKERQAKEEAKTAAKPSTPSNNDEQSTSNVKSPHTVAAKPTIPSLTPGAGGNGSDTDTSTTSKKRKDAPTDIMAPTAPKAMRLQKEQQARQQQDQSSSIEKNFIDSMEALKNMPAMPASMGMSMPMNPMMGGYSNMNNMMPNNMQQQWNGHSQNQNQGYGNMGYQNYNQGMNMNNNNNFPNQQRSAFSAEQPNQQDAYERKPLNPHRAQNKRKQRAPDFHYV
ncbi:DWNN domain-containing protein [Dendryphion nanum]|uniref:DWNN domain-containing protein n=1 Tax=Dendryphion nanum TaxID=256645 RepID=A0A9P9DFZ7_9PLEO|nr:DWNN domain-containing protein [Dendryphion nanum]